jgi:N-glycosylase/DNA lyase
MKDDKIAGYSFPTAEILANCTEQEISDCCKAGYRCKYIIEASKLYIKEPIDVNHLGEITKEQARKEISKYMGVGPKVADCILLFTGARKDVFPVDVWVSKLMNALYVPGITDKKEIEKYACDYFGENAGIAHQYLFYYAREHFDQLINTI